ncbi:SGNH/GDSL hydrolase family protein [Carboxylicivirga linearis]|uniref:SGNH hydrolase-type esterase domain-containing protein n=1 Tax=Carboxylicivirga linearis TaxID=1628157 RepID=A0ABS5JTC0_9BACT|nr:SGNH/GDSL hydrolase family protein [Carboxylicivirga linearis]MBS2098163.1 hypothetical protein [Carboxylicivirga linearis]
MKKNTKFKIIAILLPFFFLLLFEIGLRLSGYGVTYNVFSTIPDEEQSDYLVINQDITKKYFRNNVVSSDNPQDVFLASKTDSTFRIFVQGASTVVGFPFYHGGSFPNILRQRLSQTFPDKNIEVINTGITAVNTYTLLDFTDEIIEQKPDVVIIYAGHNEYYGALGVGSSSNFGSHPAIVRTYLAAKDLRIFQLVENTLVKLTGKKKQPKVDDSTVMEKMVKHQRIPFNSNLYKKGLNQFEDNLEKILRKYAKNNIPVILSTLVSNEKDLKPFISDSLSNANLFANEIIKDTPETVKLAQKNAKAAYLLGREYLKSNTDSAKKYLHLAKELDLLRFRAPEKINDIILSLGKKYNCHMVDMEKMFLNHTEQDVVGNELLTEHVHPNVEGYFVMADAFYNKLRDLQLIGSWNHYISSDEAFNNIPITAIDSLRGAIMVENLKKSWPFDLSSAGSRFKDADLSTENRDFEHVKARELFRKESPRKDIMLQAYKWYKSQGNSEQCLRIIQSDILETPDWTNLYLYAGDLCIEQDNLKQAIYYYTKYHQFEDNSLSAQRLSSAYIKNNQTELARKVITEALSKNINDTKLNKLLNEIN